MQNQEILLQTDIAQKIRALLPKFMKLVNFNDYRKGRTMDSSNVLEVSLK